MSSAITPGRSSSRNSQRVLTVLGLLLAGSVAAFGLAWVTPSKELAGLDPRIASIMHKPYYPHAQWGLFQQNPATGEIVQTRSADQFFIPGSVAKLFSVSGTWHTLGSDHRFVTPVHAVGKRQGATLTGDLALVAQGDLTLGGRTRADGTVAFTAIDHTYADDVPGATLTRRTRWRHRPIGPAGARLGDHQGGRRRDRGRAAVPFRPGARSDPDAADHQ